MFEGWAKRWPLIAAALLMAVLSVTGCRLDEKGRQIQFEKGTYLGEPDQKLTEQQLHELRSRARHQQ